MNVIINILLRLTGIILNVNSEENNTNIISLKFKTYYPCSNNSLYNPGDFTKDDYEENIHFSKIYLKVGVGDENNFKSKTNQTLNIIIDLKEIIFSTTNIYFEKYTSENNDILCHYNTSESSTFTEGKKYFNIDGIKTLSSYSKEYFQIYTDISLIKYKTLDLYFANTINHNISNICGNIGLGTTNLQQIVFNFLAQLHTQFRLPEYSFTFNYSNKNSDEGIFIFGNMPHVYLPNKYKYENLVSIYSNSNTEPLIDCDEILIGGKRYKTDLKDKMYKIKINPDIEGFEFPEKIFIDLEDIFFEKYFEKKICHKEVYDRVYRIIYCNKGVTKFEEKDIKFFPKITFYLGKIPDNFTANFNGEDLFYFKNDKYFFRIIEDVSGINTTNIILGRYFFKKYLTVFNQDKKQVYFYYDENNNKDGENDENKNNNKNNDTNKTITIIIISSIICLLIFFPLGIYFGKQIFKKRNRKAYELSDGYDYSVAQDNEENLDIN